MLAGTPDSLRIWATTGAQNIRLYIEGNEKHSFTIVAAIMAAPTKLPLSLIAAGKTDAVEDPILVRSGITRQVTSSPVGRWLIRFVDGYRGFAVYTMMINLSGSYWTATASIAKRS
jgi:hypothetical protein